jgi:hypothetical protein
MTVHTVLGLRNRSRRVDHKLARAQTVLERMAGGAALHLEFAKRPCWSLSTGEQVDDAVAQLVIRSSSVIACGGSLFPGLGLPGQVWRFWRDEEENGA